MSSDLTFMDLSGLDAEAVQQIQKILDGASLDSLMISGKSRRSRPANNNISGKGPDQLCTVYSNQPVSNNISKNEVDHINKGNINSNSMLLEKNDNNNSVFNKQYEMNSEFVANGLQIGPQNGVTVVDKNDINKDIKSNGIIIFNSNNHTPMTVINKDSCNTTNNNIDKNTVNNTPTTTKTWASLLKPSEQSPPCYNKTIQKKSTPPHSNSSAISDKMDTANGNNELSTFECNVTCDAYVDERSIDRLNKIVRSHIISSQVEQMVPRGFTNKSNRCYANSTLQALLSCAQFSSFMSSISSTDSKVMAHLKLPVLKFMFDIYTKLEPMKKTSTPQPPTTSQPPQQQQPQQQQQRKNRQHQQKQQQQQQQNHQRQQQQQQQIYIGPPIETNLKEIIENISYKVFELNQQEDAEEFLSCILNKMHEELINLCLIKYDFKRAFLNNNNNNNKDNYHNDDYEYNGHMHNNNGGGADDDDDGNSNSWQQARPRNKLANSVDPSMLERSAISDIFRGQVAHLLECPGQKDSLTLQPFITVQLDVQHQSVISAQEALKKFAAREAVTNYTNSSKIKVDATKRTLFDVLPKVLVLHFKWFKYDAKGGLLKNTKQFYLDECLEIQDDLMTPHSSRRMAAHMKRYELFAVVTHIGSQAIGGHYYTDAFHKGYMQWLRYDDEKIHKVKMSQVYNYSHPRVPYLVFYKQQESSSSSSSASSSQPQQLQQQQHRRRRRQ